MKFEAKYQLRQELSPDGTIHTALLRKFPSYGGSVEFIGDFNLKDDGDFKSTQELVEFYEERLTDFLAEHPEIPPEDHDEVRFLFLQM